MDHDKRRQYEYEETRRRYLYITCSGWRKTIVHPEHVGRLEIVTDPHTGMRVPKVGAEQGPSGELWMHWNLQRDSKRTRTVVHVHATHVVGVIYAELNCRLSVQNFLKSRALREQGQPFQPCRRNPVS
jgi:ribulose-5-phosphate 4-epimerase/fuculose-1-phosphate aldolase